MGFNSEFKGLIDRYNLYVCMRLALNKTVQNTKEAVCEKRPRTWICAVQLTF